MNAKQLKQAVKIVDFLRINNVPDKNEFFVLSPFREESDPSFKINMQKNTWFDFGEGVGGTIIDLVCRLNNCNVKRAIQILNKFVNGNYIPTFSFSPAQIKIKKNSKIEFVSKASDIIDDDLYCYLTRKRKINYKFAKKYLKQVTYKINNNVYKAIGFENDVGGYELRSPNFKGCIGKKDISYFLCEFCNENQKGKRAVVFEGFMDFLSALTFYKKEDVDGDVDVYVLNSVSLVDRVDLNGYDSVALFLDNDEAGNKATDYLLQKFKDVNIKDYRFIYKDYKDFNEFLVK